MCRADGQPVTVLVVDDEAVLAEMVSMALRYEGWNITTAGDGSTAIAAARTERTKVLQEDQILLENTTDRLRAAMTRLAAGSVTSGTPGSRSLGRTLAAITGLAGSKARLASRSCSNSSRMATN